MDNYVHAKFRREKQTENRIIGGGKKTLILLPVNNNVKK